MRVAVMQPYFYPYMGYFQLMAAVDLFVLFDCVQFPRRGRVHRSQQPDGSGRARWLTLPLSRQPQQVSIGDLRFAEGWPDAFAARCASFPWLRPDRLPENVQNAFCAPMTTPIAYIERNLRAVADHLSIDTPMVRPSSLKIPATIKRGDRVRAVARACGARHYLNAPGGRALYNAAEFAHVGLELEFLAPYAGPHMHMLYDLTTCDQDALARDAAAWARVPA